MYPSQGLHCSMTSNNDGSKTVICPTQNLSLIKSHYSGINIIILPFSYFIKHKHIEVHTELLNSFAQDCNFKLQFEIFLIILDMSLNFSRGLQNTETLFERFAT